MVASEVLEFSRENPLGSSIEQNENMSVNRVKRHRAEAKPSLDTTQAEKEELENMTKKIAGQTFALVKEMMEDSSFMEAALYMKKQMTSPKENNAVRVEAVAVSAAPQDRMLRRGIEFDNNSVTTIYDNAVRNEISKNYLSSSSEGEGLGLDTSDESNDTNNFNQSMLTGIDMSGG